MTEEEIKAEAEKKVAEESAKREAFEKAQAELKTKNVDDLVSIINETRSEARDRRLKEKELEAELAKMKDEQKTKTEAKLQEEGKLQELIDAQKKELELVRAEADESKQLRTALSEKYKSKHGDKWLEEYNKLSLVAMDALDNSLSANTTDTTTDTGVTNDKLKIELTAVQKADAVAKYPHIDKAKAYEYHTQNLIKRGIIKPKEK